MQRDSILNQIGGALIASCQPVPGGPTDRVDFIVAFALAARHGGARGLRIEGVENVRAVAGSCDLPIIGLVKRDLPDTGVRITPFIDDTVALARAGARIVAFDATIRARPTSVAALVAAIHGEGALAMADISSVAEAEAAIAAGVDLVGTTLSGYVGPGPTPDDPDLVLVRACGKLGGAPVIAEGRYNSPALAAAAMRAGASAVVVGSAITRPEYVAGWFAKAIHDARPRPVLALDIGGTKTAVALVLGGRLLERLEVPTERAQAPDFWLEAAATAVREWSGRYGAVSAAVSGLVHDGVWRAVNPGVLSIPSGYPLVERLGEVFGAPSIALNDAQAAAWGEYVHGAGQGRDMVFVTVSSGIGGGVVVDGRLARGRSGFAGHIGQIASNGGKTLENVASGFALGRLAAEFGRKADAREVFEAAGQGQGWALDGLDAAAGAIAAALGTVQRMLDPDVIVMGGSVGLAPGFIERVEAAAKREPDLARPALVRAMLGHDAGLVGAAELAA